MKTNILLDTNIFLAKVLPKHLWKEEITTFFDKLEKIKKKNKKNLEILTTELIREEISRIINQVVKFLNKEYRIIINGIQQLDQPFDKESLLELKRRFNQAISAQKRGKTRERDRQMLLFIENHLLQVISENPTAEKKTLLFQVFNTVNNFEVQLKNSIEQLLIDQQIRKIILPQEIQEQQKIDKLKKKIALQNTADARILAHFLYHLELTQKHEASVGLLLTLDFGDFHAYSSRLETLFTNLTILRPNYLLCFFPC